MNKKQLGIIILGTLALAAIFMYTPRYKVAWIDTKNYIKTEQTSSLYKRSKGTVKLHWERIALYGGLVLLACGALYATQGDHHE